MIEAAGGVVWRPANDGKIEIAVIHRPHRKDWSLPKGKREPGESMLECAVREVREETGFECAAGPEIVRVEYRHRTGRRKAVRYFAMRYVSGKFVANAEVDELRWLALDRARRRLSRDRDVDVVDRLRAAVILPV